jgi:hypothetical protein
MDFIFGRGKGDDDEDFENLELPNVVQVALDSIMGNSEWLNFSLLQSVNSSDTSSGILGGGSIVPFPLVTSGIMLTADENSAIQCLLENNNIPHTKFLKDIPPFFWE